MQIAYQQLDRVGIAAEAIHGNKPQNARQRALESFKNGTAWVLVATDIAARGIDIDAVSHVFNSSCRTNRKATCTGRRTGRAGASGIAMSLCDSLNGRASRDREVDSTSDQRDAGRDRRVRTR